MQARFSKSFAKQLGKHSLKVQKAFEKRLTLFLIDPFDPLLSNHALVGNYSGYRSINISGDLRAVYQLTNDNLAYFVDFGTHSQLYG